MAFYAHSHVAGGSLPYMVPPGAGVPYPSFYTPPVTAPSAPYPSHYVNAAPMAYPTYPSSYQTAWAYPCGHSGYCFNQQPYTYNGATVPVVATAPAPTQYRVPTSQVGYSQPRVTRALSAPTGPAPAAASWAAPGPTEYRSQRAISLQSGRSLVILPTNPMTIVTYGPGEVSVSHGDSAPVPVPPTIPHPVVGGSTGPLPPTDGTALHERLRGENTAMRVELTRLRMELDAMHGEMVALRQTVRSQPPTLRWEAGPPAHHRGDESPVAASPASSVAGADRDRGPRTLHPPFADPRSVLPPSLVAPRHNVQPPPPTAHQPPQPPPLPIHRPAPHRIGSATGRVSPTGALPLLRPPDSIPGMGYPPLPSLPDTVKAHGANAASNSIFTPANLLFGGGEEDHAGTFRPITG